jgi:hypothetical protein
MLIPLKCPSFDLTFVFNEPIITILQGSLGNRNMIKLSHVINYHS